MDHRAEAWNRLYSSDARPWRGVDPASAASFGKGGRILEVGCGNGKTASALAAAGFSVVCCDFSHEAVSLCKSNVPDAEDWVVADARELPFPNGVFDGVSMVHVLEHLSSDVTDAVAEALRVLKPGGVLCAKSFSEGDMRAGKGEERDGFVVRGNGIGYVYRSAGEFAGLFPGASEKDVETTSKGTRFGGKRETVSITFSKP